MLIKIAVLVTYYGKIPWYFKFFVKSCTWNPDIDFFLITDIHIDGELPANVLVIPKSLAEIRDLATRKFGFPVALDNAYKLCDLKPAYGFLFSEYIRGYDFWGHSDLDLIFGDIRSFFTREFLEKYDVISTREEYVTGFFTLFRNTENIRTLFMQSPDYRAVFLDPVYFGFDECNWNFNHLWNGGSVFTMKAEIQSMTYVIKKLQLAKKVSAFFKTIAMEGTPEILEWRSGELICRNKERFLLYHFIELKNQPFLYIPTWKRIPDRFYIHPFYLTSYSPESGKGKRLDLVLRALKYVHKTTDRLFNYGLWKLNYLIARKKMGDPPAVELKPFLGTYKWENQLVEISVILGRLYALLDEDYKVNLVRQNRHTYIAEKFTVSLFVNPRIRFYYDQGQDKHAFTLSSSNMKKFTFYKV